MTKAKAKGNGSAEPVEEESKSLVDILAETAPKPQQSKAAQARWAGESATETELRAHFGILPLDKAFVLYERMRRNLEIAGRILNDRSNVPEIQYCKTCRITMEDYQKKSRKNDWYLNRHHYHQGDHNVIVTEHFCSAACVCYENNKTQGVYGIADQGMLPSDNPKNHPREFPGEKG